MAVNLINKLYRRLPYSTTWTMHFDYKWWTIDNETVTMNGKHTDLDM